MKKQYIWWAILLMAILFVLYFVYGSKIGPQKISLGAVIPVTGPVALSGGEQCSDGIALAVEDINKNGGIKSVPVEMTIEDSKSNSKDGVSALMRLLAINKPIAVVSMTSSLSMSLAPVLTENKIPLIATITSAPQLTEVNALTYRYFPVAKQEVVPIIKIAKSKGIKTFAVLHLNDDFGKAMEKALADNFEGKVVEESFSPTDNNFETQLLKLKKENPDALLVVGYAGQIIAAAKQMNLLGLKTALFLPSTGSIPSIRKGLAEAGVDAYIPSPLSYKSDSLALTNLAERFKAKNGGRLLFDHNVVACYDTVKLLGQILETEKSTSKDIISGLNSLKSFSGLLGDVTISGKEFSFPLSPALIHAGEITFLDIK